MISEREQCAYHEAGHAIVCCALHGIVISADIIPDGLRGGVVHYRSPDNCDTQVAICLAGGLTQWELGWRRGEKLNGCSYSDLEQVDDLLRLWYHGDHPPRDSCDEFIDGERLALQTIANFWGAIESVAARLMSHDRIRGPLIHRIVELHKLKAVEANENGRQHARQKLQDSFCGRTDRHKGELHRGPAGSFRLAVRRTIGRHR